MSVTEGPYGVLECDCYGYRMALARAFCGAALLVIRRRIDDLAARLIRGEISATQVNAEIRRLPSTKHPSGEHLDTNLNVA